MWEKISASMEKYTLSSLYDSNSTEEFYGVYNSINYK